MSQDTTKNNKISKITMDNFLDDFNEKEGIAQDNTNSSTQSNKQVITQKTTQKVTQSKQSKKTSTIEKTIAESATLAELKRMKIKATDKKSKRINLVVTPSIYEQIIQHVNMSNENINVYITNAIIDRMIKDTKTIS